MLQRDRRRAAHPASLQRETEIIHVANMRFEPIGHLPVLARLRNAVRRRNAEDVGAQRRVVERAVQVGADHPRAAHPFSGAVFESRERFEAGSRSHRRDPHVDLDAPNVTPRGVVATTARVVLS